MKQIKTIFNRQVINYPKLQYGVTGFFVLLGAINLIFFGVLLRVLYSRVLTEIDSMSEEQKKYFLPIFNEISDTVFHSTLLFGLFILIFSFFGGIVLLQHISGPSYVIKQFLSDWMVGKKTRYPIKLRKYDFFSEQADLLNSVYEKTELNKKDDKK
ncbi:MAG: hypothetical protein JNM24_00560 [Bdellovibrionaceae bacterium]|nr:hypothetical protein [Pseudobdellovibrionaceae bacterium]